MTEEQIRERFAVNLIRCRKSANMTQLDLAEQINYSDKSISKWERGEGVPDLYVLVQIAELFEVTVDDLLSDKPPKKKGVRVYNRGIITLMALILPWLVATLLFFMFQVFWTTFPAWYFFLYAVTADAIVAIVFTKLWWHRFWLFLSISALIWMVPTCAVVMFHYPRISLIYIVASVLQVLTVLWFLIKKAK